MTCTTVAVFVVLITVTSIAADDLGVQSHKVLVNATDITQNKSFDVEEGRIRHGHHFLPFYGGLLGLGGLGGLNALAVLFAIKLKIVVVAAIIFTGIYYYSKYFKRSCHGETIHPYEEYSIHGPPTGYSNHGPSGPPEYSSYTGPDPYSAYSSLHPDISSISDLHHHATGFEEHSSNGFEDHHHDNHDHSFGDSHGYESRPPPNFNGHDQFSAGDASNDGPPGISPTGSPDGPEHGSTPAIEKSSPYRRVSIQKRQLNQNLLQSINWGEIAFQFLGVDTDGCRRRFVCELDFRSRRNPITRMAFGLIGQDFFDRYRDLSADGKKPTKYEDCSRMFRECAAAGAYDNKVENEEENEGDNDEEVNTEEIVTGEEDVDDAVTEVTEPTQNDLDEIPAADEARKLMSGRSRLAHIILKLSENEY